MRFLAAIILFATIAPYVHAQGISPLVTELKAGKKGTKTQLTLINASVFPLIAVLQPYSLTFDQGKASIQPLTDNHVELSETTIKIPAKQNRTVEVSMSCAHLPCAFTITSAFSGAHTPEGMGIVVRLGSAYYVCAKQRNCRATIMQEPPLSAQR